MKKPVNILGLDPFLRLISGTRTIAWRPITSYTISVKSKAKASRPLFSLTITIYMTFSITAEKS